MRIVGNGRFACLRILSSSKWRSDQIHSRAPSAGIDSSAPRRFMASRAIKARCRRFSFSALAFTIPSSCIEYAQSS